MRILIVGANSFIARNFIANIISSKMDIEIIGLVRDIKKSLIDINNNIYNIECKGISLLEFDLNNFDYKVLPAKVDEVYYFAQSRNYKEFSNNADEILEVNLNAANKFAFWACKKQCKSFIYFSSGGIKNFANIIYNNYYKTKMFSDNDISFYLRTKLCAEIILESYSNLFRKFIIFRPFFVYGPFQSEKMIIPTLVNNVWLGKPIYLIGNNGIKINPIFIADAVEIIKLSMLKNMEGRFIFDIAGKEIITIKQLAKKISKFLGKKPSFERIKNNLSIKKNILGDSSETYRFFNFQPKFDISLGLELTIKSFNFSNF